jgi:hypothetical protein
MKAGLVADVRLLLERVAARNQVPAECRIGYAAAAMVSPEGPAH